jgi:hypothetical protein
MSPFENDIKAKEADRQKMDAKLQRFLKAGGQIQRPQLGRHKALPMRAYNDAAWARRTEQ